MRCGAGVEQISEVHRTDWRKAKHVLSARALQFSTVRNVFGSSTLGNSAKHPSPSWPVPRAGPPSLLRSLGLSVFRHLLCRAARCLRCEFVFVGFVVPN